jgi:SAM-dependent methyltransferase
MPVESITSPHARRAAPARRRRVLHTGCGHKGPHRLHPVFQSAGAWEEIRLDVDASVMPDIVCSTSNMRHVVPTASVDAIWSSHSIEHLFDHEVPQTLAEFLRVLRPDGFALIRCPDLQAIFEQIAKHGLESIAYKAPAGPITPLDMLYGHRASVARGETFMAHHTGFTDVRLGRLLLEAGFAEINVKRAPGFDLWAIAFAGSADIERCLADLARAGLDFYP